MLIFSSTVLLTPVLCLADTDPAIEAETHKIAHTVLSPYCPGRLLSDCPSKAASDLKKEIYKKLDSGMSPEAVVEDLYMTFGDKIRAVPATHGFGLFAWIAPFAFLLLGGLALFLWLRFYVQKSASQTEAIKVDLSKEEEEKLAAFFNKSE